MAQLTLDQLRRFGLTPDTNLGQHFLVDDNVLRVIERMADLQPADVCYEPGVGVGVLTDFLARRTAHVHGVEMDRRLEAPIDAMLEDLDNVTIHWSDATRLDVSTLEPVPNKLVSNLPYHVAAPIVAETIQHAPWIRSGCVMVQKEVGERFFAPEGSKGYNALSVLLRTTCTRTATHKVSRQVFAPPPNVDSVLVAFERHDDHLEPDEVAAYAAFVKLAFAHRRKTLANNLQSAGVCARELTVAALDAVELPPTARPEQVSPERFVQLFRQLAVDGADG
ncbi:MAG: ribosomal RNA small subunit methyltransferase A [Thermoleophilia bacterium]|nr:ribosomal RNA small subunit methyltransferase A [Thermoleophilia bacterium]